MLDISYEINGLKLYAPETPPDHDCTVYVLLQSGRLSNHTPYTVGGGFNTWRTQDGEIYDGYALASTEILGWCFEEDLTRAVVCKLSKGDPKK